MLISLYIDLSYIVSNINILLIILATHAI